MPSSTMPPSSRTRRRRARRRAATEVKQALFGIEFGFIGNVFEFFFANHVDGDLNQIADHRFDIAAHITDFGKLRGFDFQER